MWLFQYVLFWLCIADDVIYIFLPLFKQGNRTEIKNLFYKWALAKKAAHKTINKETTPPQPSKSIQGQNQIKNESRQKDTVL